MPRGRKSNANAKTVQNKKSANITWLNPHIPAADGQQFVHQCANSADFFADNLAALCSNASGFSVAGNDDGSFRGFVFFNAGSSGNEKQYAVRSDSATVEGTLLGLLFKFVVLLECGHSEEFQDVDTDFSMFK